MTIALNTNLVHAAEEPALAISPLVVVGNSKIDYNQGYLAGALDSVTRDEIAGAHVDNALELFTKLPGIHMAPWGQGVFESEIGIRGFAADGPTPHAKLLIDGIPSNMHGGFNDLAQVFTNNIDSINIYKGTSDPRYGLYNLAGSYNVETRSDSDRSISASLGSFNARETQGYIGLKSGALTQNYSFGYRNSDGYRDHDHVEKYGVSGRWFYDISDTTSLGFIARVTRMDTDAPGFLLSSEVAHTNPTSSASYSNQDGGHKDTDAFSLHFDHQFSNDITWSVKSYFNQYDRQRWVRFKEASSLQERIYDEQHYGVLSTLTWNINNDWSLIWGANAEKQDVIEQRWRTINNQRIRNTSGVIWDFDYDYINYGSYIQVDNTPVDWLEWNAAIRVDRLDGDGDFNKSGVVTHKELYDFGSIVQPKLNLFIYPSEQWMLFANYGRSFQPVLSQAAYTAGDVHSRDISINDGWEIGAKWLPIEALQLRLSYWQQKAKDEFVLVNGVEQNVGKTLRQGIDLGADWTVNNQLTIWGNYSTTDTEIQTEGTTKGNELRSIPNYTASLGMTYQIQPKLTWRLHYDLQGDYQLNEANNVQNTGGYKLVNSNLEYTTNWGSVNLQVNNLFDERYEYAYDFPQDGSGTVIHAPGDGINANVSMTYQF
jgi:iron complex outermembrane receptor protein